jgi:hypothetical protein
MFPDQFIERSQLVSTFEPHEKRLPLIGRKVEEALPRFCNAGGFKRSEPLMIRRPQPGERTVELMIDEVDGSRLGRTAFIIERDNLFRYGCDKRRFLSVQQVGSHRAASSGEAASSGDPKQPHLGYDTAFFAGVEGGWCWQSSLSPFGALTISVCQTI